MGRVVFLLFAVCAWAADPAYTAASIVNGASGQSSSAAPNTILSIYGTNLASGTHAVSAEELRAGAIPTTMQGTRVLLSGQLANLYFVSPGQINLLIPASLKPSKIEITVLSDGKGGPDVPVQLNDAAPGLFQVGPYIASTDAVGHVLTEDHPARPGDIVVLYATGLGPATEKYNAGELARAASFIKRFNEFIVLVAGNRLDASRVFYAGVTPGYAGLYQVNLQLPGDCPPDPEIRVGFDGNLSPEAVQLRVKRD